MKKVLFLLFALAGASYVFYQLDPADEFSSPASSIDARETNADAQWRSGQQVRATGTVSRILPDDNDGSRHQRFVLRLSSGRTLLIAHNIDLAPRVSSLQTGDTVSFFGEYEWNDRGGVIHWTHHDPQGRHADGWLEHKGRRYQ
jgi:hypothetical protein